MFSQRLVLTALASSLLVACAVGPEYQRPAVELPAAWRDAPDNGRPATDARWWALYEDSVLDRLIDEALLHNHDLALAAARVEEARALSGVADAAQLPSVDASAQRDRSRSSAISSTPLPPSVPLERNSSRAQLNVAYEVDLWGRLRGASAAARADVLATHAARDTVHILLVTDVVRSYFTLLSLDAQVATTERSLLLRQDNLRLQQIRHTAGLVSDFELRQLEAEVAAARAQLPALERSRTSEQLALAVLLGRSPRAITEDTVLRATDHSTPPPLVVPANLPSELLLRRPDVVEAEQRLIAANARIGVARASLFPSISLTGFLGSESAALSDLFSGPARIWQLAFGLTQPIFQGGRLRSEIQAVEAREQQALAHYQKTLQEAFREVRQALSAQQRSREIFEAEGARASALRDALRLARIRYENGLVSQIEALDAERSLLAAEFNRHEALRAQRTAVADLMKALGGGWR